jgi:hypothetical protein
MATISVNALSGDVTFSASPPCGQQANPQGTCGSLPAMVSQSREHQIILNFGPDTRRAGEMHVHALHTDCKTVLSHWQAVETVETLRKMMRYLGATDEQMMSFENSLRRWGQGSVHMRLLPDRRNLLHIDYSRL